MKKSITKKRRSLYVPPALASRIQALAVMRGISFNAAMNVLLAEALSRPVPARAFHEAQAAGDIERAAEKRRGSHVVEDKS